MSRFGLGNCHTIRGYVNSKIESLLNSDKTFGSLYELMFSERENVFCERTDGHRIVKTSYGEAKDAADRLAAAFSRAACDIPLGSIVGLCADNSERWIEAFWAILRCGYRPLLMNIRLGGSVLEEILAEYSVAAVVTDGMKFSVPYFLLDALTGADGVSAADAPDNWADEAIVMSSGTSENIKLCCYTGENFAYQILDSAQIIKTNKLIKRHYKNKLKLLAFLPLYHIFGLAAMYMWFGFFSRTFVFLNGFDADSILYTIRRHEVTHIFAVPLLWNKVYDGLYSQLARLGERTCKKFERGLKIAERSGSALFSRLAFGEVRSKLFGNSVKFMITGGGAISPTVLALFNAIGYPLANGYGMSEVGITSVELSPSAKVRARGAIGKPFPHITYTIGADGELFVSGKSAATRIFEGGREVRLGDGAYPTHDLVKADKGRYYMLGRQDDLIVGANGENINPDYAESRMNIAGALDKAIIRSERGGCVAPVLVVSLNKYSSEQKRRTVRETAERELVRLGLASQIRTVALTSDALIEGDEFKLNRKRLARRYDEGAMRLIDDSPELVQNENDELAAELRTEFAAALGKPVEEIGDDMNFFFELGGSSFDYFALVSAVTRRYGVDFPVSGGASLTTVRAFGEFIRKHS